MRWWLALAFAAIAAVTAFSVAEVFTSRSEERIRERSRELAAGEALTAAVELSAIEEGAAISAAARALGAERNMALFVLDRRGRLLTRARVDGISVRSLSNFDELRSTALAGRRLVDTIDGGQLVTVALPLRGEDRAALIAVAPRSDLEDALGIVRAEIARSALLAIGIGAAVGLIVASLITRRLSHIAAAAREIEQGNFDLRLRPRFRDELGLLAETIDTMSGRLRASFAQLADERDRVQRLLEQLNEGVIAVDDDLVVEFVNARARALVDGELEPGQRLPDPWPGFSLPRAARALFRPDASSLTTRIEPRSGASYTVALLPPSGMSRSGVIVITDDTEQERRERAEREFVMFAAHELRTPLAAIAGAVEALRAGASEEQLQRDRFLAVVDRQTQRLTRLTRSLLTLARAQTRSEQVQLQPIELAPVFREVAAELPTTPEMHVCCRDVAAHAHPELLRQALENLTTNALKHAGGKDLALRASHTDGGRYVRIEVADGGPGIPFSEAGRATDRFYRGRDAGSDGFGLGLAIVREVVAAMDGSLAFRSTPGSGTTVSVMLRSASRQRGCL
ncbi:MAG: hypothetical protein KatS3mg012_2510 [Gaiellaceae bacterium]|jgi:signal transduction histidine kinase|nr:MAG: hypothetical protein KatS3mg012_2510 [Gaiellaceae bacterium]